MNNKNEIASNKVVTIDRVGFQKGSFNNHNKFYLLLVKSNK